MLTDTGGFRFSNTSPRCLSIAGAAAGARASSRRRCTGASTRPCPSGRLHLLRDALHTLEVDEADRDLVDLGRRGRAGAIRRSSSEDLDGIVEHPRSIAGTRLALFFRDLGHGKVKVSFRSTGDVDVNAFAKQFGGGGHAKAAGALITGHARRGA